MRTALIIDGNYLLNKLVFPLHSEKLLYGALYRSLENSLKFYKSIYPFEKVYFVSDSKKASWRKKFLTTYKENRIKNVEIDWEFCFTCYNEFKQSIISSTIMLEEPEIEGDDWISYIVDKCNKESMSTYIVSVDHDIKQLLKWNIDPLFMNIMCNEQNNKQKLYLPKGYNIFMNKLSKSGSKDLFNTNDNFLFLETINKLIEKYEIKESDPAESLFVKIISGDKGDNIPSCYKSMTKTGKERGIGAAGAESLHEEYIKEFSEVDFNNSEIFQNIAELICESKKLASDQVESIKKNLGKNYFLINLDLSKMPKNIVSIMDGVYENLGKKEVDDFFN
jgi:5'-3' exonuclease